MLTLTLGGSRAESSAAQRKQKQRVSDGGLAYFRFYYRFAVLSRPLYTAVFDHPPSFTGGTSDQQARAAAAAAAAGGGGGGGAAAAVQWSQALEAGVVWRAASVKRYQFSTLVVLSPRRIAIQEDGKRQIQNHTLQVS
jgi:hypothetical protein